MSPDEWLQLSAAAEDPATIEQEWYFEVSKYTQRIHFHGSEDGSRPLLLSLPMELLLDNLPDAEPLRSLWHRLEPQCRRPGDAPGSRARVLPGIGLICPADWVTPAVLFQALKAAQAFVSEWWELRAVHMHRLYGSILCTPLAEAVTQLEVNSGAGTARYLTQPSLDALPEGAEWREVTVAHKRWGVTAQFRQAFSLSSGARHCLECQSVVEGSETTAATEVLSSNTLLFCTGKCEAAYAMKRSGGAIRRALFKLERGVCTIPSCRLDCHALVKRLQTIEKGTLGWESKRTELVRAAAPAFARHGNKALLMRLVHFAVEGNAWHADHIVPVYQGGGGCGLENFRTLCVVCHKQQTALQATERAAERRALIASNSQGSLKTSIAKLVTKARQAIPAPIDLTLDIDSDDEFQ